MDEAERKYDDEIEDEQIEEKRIILLEERRAAIAGKLTK